MDRYLRFITLAALLVALLLAGVALYPVYNQISFFQALEERQNQLERRLRAFQEDAEVAKRAEQAALRSAEQARMWAEEVARFARQSAEEMAEERRARESAEQRLQRSTDARRQEGRDPRAVDMLFATSRKVEVAASRLVFTNERAQGLNFGTMRVRIPEHHKIGRIELPNTRNFILFKFTPATDEAQHFILP